jgi:hypothetical protein
MTPPLEQLIRNVWLCFFKVTKSDHIKSPLLKKTLSPALCEEGSACQSRNDVFAKAAPVLTSRTLLS